MLAFLTNREPPQLRFWSISWPMNSRNHSWLETVLTIASLTPWAFLYFRWVLFFPLVPWSWFLLWFLQSLSLKILQTWLKLQQQWMTIVKSIKIEFWLLWSCGTLVFIFFYILSYTMYYVSICNSTLLFLTLEILKVFRKLYKNTLYSF